MARAHDQRADGFDRRLAHIEGQLERAPTHNDLAAIHEKLNATTGGMRELAGMVKGMDDTLRLILARIAEKGMS